ncbi:6-bladed beta-propeller [Algoriphagus sp.]|uniref:6-bladed beta-propeller n=1 Tax=Algoriphagus sp. TaxID=1872435 RepID=UPI00391B0A24
MKKILLVSLAVTSMGCSDLETEKLKISVNLENSETGKFSDLFSSIDYLLLDMGENEVLVRPYHIDFSSDKIIVEDRDLANIHIFDRTGKLQSSIKSSDSGGPNSIKQTEYIQVVEDKIYVSDIPLKKIITFNLYGNFIEEKKEQTFFDAFHYFGKERVLFLGLKNNPNQKLFIRETLADNDTSALYKFPIAYDWMGIGSKDGFMKDEFSKSVFFNIPYSYEIVEFNEKGEISNNFEFDFGRFGLGHNDRYRQAEARNLDKYLGENGLINNISSFFPMKDSFFMYLYQNSAEGKPTHHFLLFDRDLKLRYQSINPKNDFDGMVMGIPWTFHDNKIYVILNSVSFYNKYIELYAGQKISITPGSIHEFFQKNKEKLKDDQTVLVSLTLKDSL